MRARLPMVLVVGGMSGLDYATASATIAELSEDGEQSRDQLERDTGPATVREASHPAGLSSPDSTAFARGVSAVHEPTSPASLSSQAPGWPMLAPAALHGIAGKVVRTLDPHTEADPAAILLTFLAAAGNIICPGPQALAEAARHPARLFVVLVGETSRARKGSAWQQVRRVLAEAAPEWEAACTLAGLASGEALIDEVRDGTDDDPGVADKRRLILEPEFARLLAVASREGATLSQVIREAWDGNPLRNRTKKNPATATGAHISLVGHITREELVRRLSDTEAANGFANRFLLALVRRSKKLPEGGNLDPAARDQLAREVNAAIGRARRVGTMTRSPAARDLWAKMYDGFGDGPGGLAGAVTARPEAQCLRLSVAYAALDGSATIEPDHLHAAGAVWRYCEQSALYVFGEALGDPIADRLLAAVRDAGPAGLDGTGQYREFKGHVDRRQLERARADLERRGLVVTVPQPTRGRSRLVTRVVRRNEQHPYDSGPARKFVRGPERTSGLRSCQVRVVFVPPAAARSQLPAWDGCDPREQATPLLG
jgi:hypothetical protein